MKPKWNPPVDIPDRELEEARAEEEVRILKAENARLREELKDLRAEIVRHQNKLRRGERL